MSSELWNPMLDLAADHLLGKAPEVAGSDLTPVIKFLINLGYLEPGASPIQETVVNQQRVSLLRAAAQMRRLFMLPMPYAPGLIMMGGEVSPSVIGNNYSGLPLGSVSGSGTTLRKAFESCVGEGVEFLAQFEQDGDLVVPEPDADLIDPFPTADVPFGFDGDGGFVKGRRLGTDDIVFVPAERCLRRVTSSRIPRFALGTGCGAGRSIEEAALHGLLELIERDASALWWRGGRAASAVPLEGEGVSTAVEFLAQLRGSTSSRMSWFLDITTDLGIPCIAAISVDRDGRRVACGTSCHINLAAALIAAAKEMCQMELAYDVVEAKEKEQGEAGLNETDRRHKRRATEIDANACRLLHPIGRPVLHKGLGDTGEDLPAIVQHLDRQNIQVIMIDLTRPQFNIPVVRIIAPALQLDPCEVITKRLFECRNAAGRGQNLLSLV